MIFLPPPRPLIDARRSGGLILKMFLADFSCMPILVLWCGQKNYAKLNWFPGLCVHVGVLLIELPKLNSGSVFQRIIILLLIFI